LSCEIVVFAVSRSMKVCHAAALLAAITEERRCSSTAFAIPAWDWALMPFHVDSEFSGVFSSFGSVGSPVGCFVELPTIALIEKGGARQQPIQRS
jgi:hypothetical protein